LIKETVGEVTRQRIIQSAQKILVNEGFSAVTHRAVADDAAVPLGSTTYHFKDKQELISESLGQLLEEDRARRLKIRVPVNASAQSVSNYLVQVLVPPGFRSRKKIGILFERIVEASHSPKLSKMIDDDQQELKTILNQSLGKFGTTISAELVQAVFDGRALQWLNGKGSFESLEQVFSKDIAFLLKHQQTN
jgi:DNA-binding transcriptional regulator YbjK